MFMEKKKSLIGGEWRETSESFPVRNPFNNKTLAEVCAVSKSECEEVISLAEKTSKEMRILPRFRIAKGLRKIAEGIEKRKNDFAETIAKEAAKPINVARGEVERGIATFTWAASEAERFTGDVIPVDTQSGGIGKTGWTQRIPRGVIYGITPFNFPLNLVGHKVAPALAAGNAIIIKPSKKTPLTALLLGEVFLESGLPKSALQVVPMNTDYMETVLSDERIKMISFTGSDKVGWMLKRKCGKKVISLELGGNAPIIIDETADLEKALERTTMGAFVYSGQVCISIQRVLLHEKIATEFTGKFVQKAKNLKKGDPLKSSTQLSSMIDDGAAEKAMDWVNEALQNGAELLCGNKREGSMLNATILANVNPEMRVVSEEIFAPVAVIEKFSDFEEGVQMANHSRYGLQAGVFTRDLRNAHYAANNLEYGGVIINDVPTFRVDNMPYGGIKDSGFGREGVRYAMEEMSELRLIVLNS
jgi:glyceraldehyde-3-phosphate dehydrogenase (NADP+)